MDKKDISELRRRLTKNKCSFTRMSGCYVSSNKDILLHINETFLNLEDDEFEKYLAIAKKVFSGTLRNNLLHLEFPLEEEIPGGKQQFLMGLKESKLKNEGLLDTYYQLIIDNYDYAGNYLILFFHDVYDVIRKTKDNFALDESEDIYEYLICAICPVELTKPGLGYLEDENRIGPRNRDWVVGAPDAGFVFPAFTDRSTDIHSVLYYTKKPLEAHRELMESVLGCPAKATGAEHKNTFQSIIKTAVNDSSLEDEIYGGIQESLSLIAEQQAELSDSKDDLVILTNDTVRGILEENDLPEEIASKIEASYEESFSTDQPVVDLLIDKKIIAENNKLKVQKGLMKKVEILEEELEEARNNNLISSDADEQDIDKDISYDVFLRVKADRVDKIKAQFIDGEKYIVIPVNEDEQINVNGKTNLI